MQEDFHPTLHLKRVRFIEAYTARPSEVECVGIVGGVRLDEHAVTPPPPVRLPCTALPQRCHSAAAALLAHRCGYGFKLECAAKAPSPCAESSKSS